MNPLIASEYLEPPEERVQRRRKRRSSGWRCCGACGIIGILVLLAVAFGGMWVVAKTGLVRAPAAMFRGAFEMPAPARVVVPKGGTIETLAGEFLKPDGTVSGRVSESVLTGLLRQGLAQTGQAWIMPNRAQITMDKERGFDLFLPIKNGNQETVLRARILPQLLDNRLSIKIQEARIGTLPLPFLSALEPMIQEKLDSFIAGKDAAFRFTRFEINDGYADISGKFLKPL